MALTVLDAHSGVVLSEPDFLELVTALDLYADKFEDLFRVVLLAYAAASKTPEGRKAFRPIEQWIRDNYIDLRGHIPPDLKRLYLMHVAFPARDE